MAFALFLGLRVWGNDFGSPPTMAHADERHYVGVANRMSWADLNPHRFENPPLLTYVLFGVKQARIAFTDEASTRTWFRAGGLHRTARWICALLGALTALLVGAAARGLTGRTGVAVAAVVVVGFSFLHGRDSHFGVNDVPMVCLVSVSLLCATRGLAGGPAGWLYFGALSAGLAAATKYNGAVALCLPLAALALRRRVAAAAGVDPGPQQHGRDLLHVAGLVAAFGLAFVAANPYCLLSFEEFRQGFLNQYAGWGDRPIWGQSRSALPPLYLQACWGMFGWAHLAAALAGWVLWWRRRRATALFVALLPAVYLVGMLTKTLFFWRFVLPLLPFGALAAGVAWEALAARLACRLRRLPRSAAAPVALALVLLPASVEPAARLLRSDQLLARRPTWLQARDWIVENLPSGVILFLEGYPPAFPPGYEVVLPRVHMNTLQGHKEKGPDGSRVPVVRRGGFVVTDSFYEQAWQLEPEADERARFYWLLRNRFPMLAEFAPGPEGDAQPFVLDSLYAPLLDLWSVERPGHTIRVFWVAPRRWGQVFGG